MTDQNMEHPTQGRRRRHKSPSSVQSAPLLPVPRLADYLATGISPSDEEGGKEVKRQKSEPTTPISTSSSPPNEYDVVMGITQVDSREAERFEAGIGSNRNSKMLKKNYQKCLVIDLIQDMCLLLLKGDMVVPHCRNA